MGEGKRASSPFYFQVSVILIDIADRRLSVFNFPSQTVKL
jgi:hypothetical protein